MHAETEQMIPKVGFKDQMRFARHYWLRHKWRGLRALAFMTISVGLHDIWGKSRAFYRLIV